MFEYSTLRAGTPGRPRLIFLHGLFGCKEDWEPILSPLASQYECLAIDLPGHGNTPYREEILLHLRSLLETSPREKPILIGYSMGGRIALQLRDCAKAVIAFSSHLGLRSPQEKEEQRKKELFWQELLLTLPPELFFRTWYTQPLFASLADTPGLIDKLIRTRATQDPRPLAQVLSQLSLTKQPVIDSFPTPTLLLCGKKDRKYQQLYHNIAATVHVLEHAGHACLVENPQGCCDALVHYLETLYAHPIHTCSHPLDSRPPLHRHQV